MCVCVCVCVYTIWTEGVFVTQLSSNVGNLSLTTVWVTSYCLLSEIVFSHSVFANELQFLPRDTALSSNMDVTTCTSVTRKEGTLPTFDQREH